MQRKYHTMVVTPSKRDRICFMFSTKDRPNLARKTLKTIDTEGGYDIIWVDGSITPEGKSLSDRYVFKFARLVGVFKGVGGGPEKAQAFGLKKMLDMGYDYCGFIENDMLLKQGWFTTLINTFKHAAEGGVPVGAATIRSYKSRILEYRDGYAVNWVTGAGMVLFTREAAKILLDEYSKPRFRAYDRRQFVSFYAGLFGVDISNCIEWQKIPGWLFFYFGDDKVFSLLLYLHGLASISSIPNMVERDLGLYTFKLRTSRLFRTNYVSMVENNKGLNYQIVDNFSMFKIRAKKVLLAPLPESAIMKLYQKYKRLRYGRTPILDHMVEAWYHDRSI